MKVLTVLLVVLVAGVVATFAFARTGAKAPAKAPTEGKKVAADLHRKFCAKYVPSVVGETGFMYHWKIRPTK